MKNIYYKITNCIPKKNAIICRGHVNFYKTFVLDLKTFCYCSYLRKTLLNDISLLLKTRMQNIKL